MELDTPEARARSARRLLSRRQGIRVELRFVDGSGAEHSIKSTPVPGGRYLYDESDAWGLRALGFCHEGFPGHMAALAKDYASYCAEVSESVCRPLVVTDILRLSDVARGHSDADQEGS